MRMPAHTRGETRAMWESLHSVGLISHAALAQGIGTREAFDEAFREHELPPPISDRPRQGRTYHHYRGEIIGARCDMV